MKKILIMLLTFIALNSCQERQFQPRLSKPFVITHKYLNSGRCNKNDCGYEFTDANGIVRSFCETGTKYSLGDTIY